MIINWLLFSYLLVIKATIALIVIKNWYERIKILMDINFLAAKQKRVLEWEKRISQGQNQDFQDKANSVLHEIKEILFYIWDCGSATSEDLAKLVDAERRMEQHFEDSRLYRPHST